MARGSKRARLDLKNLTLDTDDDILKVVDGLTYNGLDLNKIRKKILKKSESAVSLHDDVISMLLTYMMIGNNVRKLGEKITNKVIGDAVKIKLRAYEVKQKPVDSESITLPRIAIAFMPAYYLLRYLSESKLQKQTSSKIDVRFMDIVFCGVPEIFDKEGYKTYYSEFNKLIEKKDDRSEEDDPEPLNSDGLTEYQASWVEIALNGYKADVKVRAIMERVLKISKEEVSADKIRETIDEIMKTVEDGQGTDAFMEDGEIG
jgi:hypothetical protein